MLRGPRSGQRAGVGDPRAEVLRSGYAAIVCAYREHLIDELAGKPLDRAFLDPFAERARGGLIERCAAAERGT